MFQCVYAVAITQPSKSRHQHRSLVIIPPSEPLLGVPACATDVFSSKRSQIRITGCTYLSLPFSPLQSATASGLFLDFHFLKITGSYFKERPQFEFFWCTLTIRLGSGTAGNAVTEVFSRHLAGGAWRPFVPLLGVFTRETWQTRRTCQQCIRHSFFQCNL